MHSEDKTCLLESYLHYNLVSFLHSRWLMVVDVAVVCETVSCLMRSSGSKSSLSQPLDGEDIGRF